MGTRSPTEDIPFPPHPQEKRLFSTPTLLPTVPDWQKMTALLAAIRIAGKHQGLLPLMITDVVMPGLSGPVLAERLAVSRPETRVLYTSGDSGGAVVRHGVLGPRCAFLEKPFTRDALIRKVRELLDAPTQS